MTERSATLDPTPDVREPSSPSGESPGDRFAELIARAKAILAGTLVPEPLPTHPEVAEFLERELGDRDPPVVPEVLTQIAYEMTLGKLYGGLPVVCVLQKGGQVGTALGVGEEELVALLRSFTREEGSKIIVHFP
jgi:hypothetical protein